MFESVCLYLYSMVCRCVCLLFACGCVCPCVFAHVGVRVFACVCPCVSWRYLKPNHFCWHVYKSRFYQLHLSMGGGWSFAKCTARDQLCLFLTFICQKKVCIPDPSLAKQKYVGVYINGCLSINVVLSEMLVEHFILLKEISCSFVFTHMYIYMHQTRVIRPQRSQKSKIWSWVPKLLTWLHLVIPGFLNF